MKNLFLKFILILGVLIGVSQIITAQNYTITDGDDIEIKTPYSSPVMSNGQLYWYHGKYYKL